MSHAATFYEVLGVTPTALTSEIKQAHRRLAQQNHPDKLNHLAGDFPWVVQEATERFKLITEAFNVLSNDAARSRYDAYLKLPPTGFHPRNATSPYAQRRTDPPKPPTSDKTGDLHTRTAEIHDHTRDAFHRYPVEDSPFRTPEPRAPKRRKNPILGGIAFVAMVTLAFATLQEGPLARELHSLQLVEAESNSGDSPSATFFSHTSTKTNANDGYQFADIHYLRTLFNAYLISRDIPSAPVTHHKEFSLLQRWDASYYQSKFIVISWENPTSNQTQVGILFLDHPDSVFQATVGRQPGAGHQLQSFTPLKYTPQQMANIRASWSQSLADRLHAL